MIEGRPIRFTQILVVLKECNRSVQSSKIRLRDYTRFTFMSYHLFAETTRSFTSKIERVIQIDQEDY